MFAASVAWTQFLCLAFAQRIYRESLRDIEACLRAQPAKLYRLGLRRNVSRSALADANEERDWRIYYEFAQSLIGSKGSPYPVVTSATRRAMMRTCWGRRAFTIKGILARPEKEESIDMALSRQTCESPLSLGQRQRRAMVVVALCVRLSFLAWYHHGPVIQGGTLIRHVTIARSLVAGLGFKQDFGQISSQILTNRGHEQLFRDPMEWPPISSELGTPTPSDTVGYAVLLATTWWATGSQRFLWVQLLQIVLDALTAVALAGIVLQLTRHRRLASTVGWIWAFFPPAARIAVNIHRDGFAIWGAVFTLWFILRHVRSRQWPPLVGAAFAAGVGCWLRPIMLPLAVGLPVAMLLHPGLDRRRVLTGGAAVLLGAGLVFLAPFMAYNQHTYGRPWAVLSNLATWSSYGEFPNRWGCSITDGAAVEYVRSLGDDLTPFSLDWDAVLSRRVDEINAAEPLLKHINAARRFPQFLVSGFSDVFSFSPDLQIRAWIKGAPDRTLVRYVLENPFVAFVRFGLGPAFWIPALLGGALSLRRWREMAVFALAPSWFIFYNIYSHFENRNVVVGMWGAVVFFAVAILWLLDRLLLWRRGEENPPRDTKPGDAD